jgi:hypothetical protein
MNQDKSRQGGFPGGLLFCLRISLRQHVGALKRLLVMIIAKYKNIIPCMCFREYRHNSPM